MSKKIDLSKMPTPDLVREFEELSTQQGYAKMWLDVPRYTKLYKLADLVAAELNNRGELTLLTTLLEHDDVWVRFHAAAKLHSTMPTEAKRVMQELAKSGSYDVACDAKMFLRPLPM